MNGGEWQNDKTITIKFVKSQRSIVAYSCDLRYEKLQKLKERSELLSYLMDGNTLRMRNATL